MVYYVCNLHQLQIQGSKIGGMFIWLKCLHSCLLGNNVVLIIISPFKSLCFHSYVGLFQFIKKHKHGKHKHDRDERRSIVSGQVIKMKVKKSSKDKEVRIGHIRVIYMCLLKWQQWSVDTNVFQITLSQTTFSLHFPKHE